MDSLIIATKIVKRLNQAGYQAFFAGGWVRDFVMKHPSDDIDIATNAPTDKILELFPRTIPVGVSFGVVIVVEKGHQFEVSTFRRDAEYDGRRPGKVELATPEEDAERRDFTINGLFYDPIEEKIYDYVNGLEDIKKGVIRAIGDADERFKEDRLRMIRAIRLAARFNFTIDLQTRIAIKKNASTLLPAVAMERIWQEFTKMTKWPRFDLALIEMQRLGLLSIVFPQLKGEKIESLVSSFGRFPENCPTILYLMELFPHESLLDHLRICDYLKLSGEDKALVEFLDSGRRLVTAGNKVSDIEWAHYYANPHSELCLEVIASHYDDAKRKSFLNEHLQRCERLLPHVQRIAHKKPLVTGTLLKTFGIPSGKLMGSLIKEALSIAIMRDLHTPEEVMHYLKQSDIWPK